MLLDLRGFRAGTDEISRQFAPDALPHTGEDFRIVSPVALRAHVTKDAQKVRLVGGVQTAVEIECSRCLETIRVPVDAPFDLMFLPVAEDSTASERDDDVKEVREDDVGVSIYKDDTIDLWDVMREQLYLALPMKPLCREDCRGLCPECGINRNRETCTCKADWIDPRMAPLKKLLEG